MFTLLRRFIAVAVLMNSVSAVHAETTKAWKDTGEFSLVTTNGNSKTTTTSAKNTFSYAFTPRTSLDLIGGGLGSSSKGTVTAEQYNASEKVSHKLTDRLSVYERFGWDKDRFAGIRNRYDASTGLGYKLLDLAADKLDSELGGGYINEERTNAPRNEFAAGRAYTKYQHIFNESTKFSQDFEYLHNFKDSDGYRFNAETALITALSTHLSLKTSFLWKRNGKPTPGVVKDDTTTSIALIVNY